MFDSFQRYVYDRRGGLLDTTISMSIAYAVNAHVRERWEEMKEKVARERTARQSLRKRFQSMHEDTCFIVMALMPSLATQILEEMDVESLTNELQTLSSRGPTSPRPCVQYPHSDSDISVSDVQSEAGSVSLSSYSGSGYSGERSSVSGSASWVKPLFLETSGAPNTLCVSSQPQLSDSVTISNSSLSGDDQASLSKTNSQSSIKARKVQLWEEVKNLTLTRMLTTLYTTTLLSLLTTTQIALLSRICYVESVRASDRAERAADRVPQISLTGILAREAVSRVIDVDAVYPKWLTDEYDIKTEDMNEALSEATQQRYLTLSWWILHVGWKDVARRVRNAVESVFDVVPLRTLVSCSDLRAHILRVQRHIELDGVKERPHSWFLSSLLPPIPELSAHVLAHGEAIPICPIESYQNRHSAVAKDHTDLNNLSDPTMIQDGSFAITAVDTLSSKIDTVDPWSSLKDQGYSRTMLESLASDPKILFLLAQTRAYLSGPDFAHALTCALDRATDVLIDGLNARVFVERGAILTPFEGKIKEHRPQGDSSQVAGAEVPQEAQTMKLVGLLPDLARWSQRALNATPNELVDNIMGVREVAALEAIIISDYQDRYPPIM